MPEQRRLQDPPAVAVAGGEAGVARGTRRRGPRRAVYVSEVDRQLLEKGLAPSWEQHVSESDLVTGGAGVQSNDQRLRENVPPHAHSRL